MFDVFRVWLMAVGAALAAGGVVLALLANNPIAAPLHRLIDRAFWPEPPDAPTTQFRAFVYGVLGGTLAGWGLMTFVLVREVFATREAWVWWALSLSFALWFVLDTGRSVRHRVWANVAVNIALLVLVAIPLAGTFNEFH